MSDNIFSNIKTIFDFGRSQEKKIFTQLKRLLKETKIVVNYVNQKSEKGKPHDFTITYGDKTIKLDVETTPLTSAWHHEWVKKGTIEEILNRGLRIPLRKFKKLNGNVHLYLKFSPDRKCFFCFVFPEIIQYLKDGKKDRKNSASHIKPFNNDFKIIQWNEVSSLKNCVIVDDFGALRLKIVEMLKK